MNIIIIGASGFALEAAWLAEDCGHQIFGFMDDDPNKQGQTVMNKPVLGGVDEWMNYSEYFYVVAVGSPRIRSKIVNKMKSQGSPKFTTLIHPSVIKSGTVEVGEGSLICAGCIMTVFINIGEHCIINLNTTVGHEVKIGDFVTIAPTSAISGNVAIEDLAEIGTGSSVRQGLVLSSGSMLGMGSVLTKNTEQNCIYTGVPAKPLKKL